mgnify:CR=1 FL=1
MIRRHRGFILLNVLGGAAILGSYAWGFLARPEETALLWGGVPMSLRPFYTACMPLAAVGYFFFTAYFLTRVDPRRPVLVGGTGWGLLHGLYAAFLVASALWLPLTVLLIREPSDALWIVIRIVLAVVGLAAVGLLVVLLASDLDRSGWLFPAAVGGLVAFCLQTAVLDALVWPHYFR